MTWLFCIIVGAILLAIAHYAAVPAPLGQILSIIGIVLVIVGIGLFVYWLVGGGVAVNTAMHALLL